MSETCFQSQYSILDILMEPYIYTYTVNRQLWILIAARNRTNVCRAILWYQRVNESAMPIVSGKNNCNICLYIYNHFDLPSSRSVNRPIWGKSLNVSMQIMPPFTSILAITTWSCLTNLGNICFFSPVFLSSRQRKACNIISGSMKTACVA